jgi:hypothetical protein
LAPSILFDVEYRIAIVALLFEAFAKPYRDSLPRMNASRLKLLQFLTLRPWLMAAAREWNEIASNAPLSLSGAARTRRAFLSDTAHDDVIRFISASGALRREGDHLYPGETYGNLLEIIDAIKKANLFQREREGIEQLRGIKITADMLEGW